MKVLVLLGYPWKTLILVHYALDQEIDFCTMKLNFYIDEPFKEAVN